MNVPYSKKELYRDNIKMRDEIENLSARNTELVIMMEQSKNLIDEANKKIKEYNKRIDDES